MFRSDVIVCLDACFTRKHSRNPVRGDGMDPPNPTQTVFLSDMDVKKMESHVDMCRGNQSQHTDAMQNEDGVDVIE